MLDKAARYWFIASTLLIAILVYLFQRRGARIEDLLYQIQRERLDSKLKAAESQVDKDRGDYEEKLKRLNELRARYKPTVSGSSES